MQCVNKNLREYQTLKKESGLSDSELSHQVGRFLEKVGRYPFLDEIKGANSEPAIRENLKLRKDNTTDTKNILEETNQETIEDSVQVLNNKYRDKEIEIDTINETSKVFITERPTQSPKEIGVSSNDNVNSFHYFNDIIDKLQSLYGINIIPITNHELNQQEWKDIPGTQQAKAFIYNGDIYINTDIATIDSPVHELLHILFGSMKYSNREMYNQIVSSAEQLDSYQEIAIMYPNRTREDVNEEVFVTELAKYLTGRSNALSKLPENIQHEIYYNINRTLDTMLMGDASVNCIPADQLYQMNLKTIAKLVNASTTKNNFQGAFTDSRLSRIMSNKKSELISEGLLKEECS